MPVLLWSVTVCFCNKNVTELAILVALSEASSVKINQSENHQKLNIFEDQRNSHELKVKSAPNQIQFPHKEQRWSLSPVTGTW